MPFDQEDHEQSQSIRSELRWCAGRFRSELNPFQPWFRLDDSNGRVVDVAASFAPAGCIAVLWKLVMLGNIVYAMSYSLIHWKPSYYLAYFTNWAVSFSLCYAVLSLMNCLCPGRLQSTTTVEHPSLRTKATWIFFELAAHSTAVAATLFWLVIFDPQIPPEFSDINCHGIIALSVWIDGLLVNRVPVRLMHYFGIVLPVDILYAIWTYLQYYLQFGNPNMNDNDPNTNDDAVYPFVDLQNDPKSTFTFLAELIFGVGPIVFCALWMISIYTAPCFCLHNHRRYEKIDSDYMLAK